MIKPSALQRFVAFVVMRIWPTEWAMAVLHTHPDPSQWLYRSLKLTDLEPRWIGINGWDAPDGVQYYTVGGRFTREAPGGVSFECPVHTKFCECCHQHVPGSHRLAVWFENPADGLPPERSATHRWHREGETFEALTLTPSINAQDAYPGCWHGFITNGEVR